MVDYQSVVLLQTFSEIKKALIKVETRFLFFEQAVYY